MGRIPIAFLAAFVCAAVLPACDSGKNAALTVWCAGMDREMVAQMADGFLASNPAVRKIDIVVCEDDKARERFEEDPSAAADVICIPHDQLGALVAGGGLAGISDAKYDKLVQGNTAPSVKAGQIEGKQYGFPSSFETQMLFYDRSLVSDEAAKTLEGILASPAPEDGPRFAMDFGNAYFSADWFLTFGCSLFGENGEDRSFCDFNSPDGVAAMACLIEKRGEFGNADGERAITLFKERRLGAYIGGPWNAAAVTEALKGNYGCARLPDIDGKGMKSFAGYKLYCVNANTKNRAAAMDLAAWLARPDSQKTRFQARNLIPVATSLSGDADVAASTTANAVMAQGPNAIAMPSIPEMSNFWAPAGEFTLACYDGQIGADGLQAGLDGLVDAIKGG